MNLTHQQIVGFSGVPKLTRITESPSHDLTTSLFPGHLFASPSHSQSVIDQTLKSEDMSLPSSVFTFVLCCGVVHGFIGGVAHKDPRPKGSMERQPRFLAIGRPNIDLRSCPEVDVVQDFKKDEASG